MFVLTARIFAVRPDTKCGTLTTLLWLWGVGAKSRKMSGVWSYFTEGSCAISRVNNANVSEHMQLRWAGHVASIGRQQLPKQLLCGDF